MGVVAGAAPSSASTASRSLRHLDEPIGAAPQQRQRGAASRPPAPRWPRHAGAERLPGQHRAAGDGDRGQRLVDRQGRAQVDRAEPEQLERRRHEQPAGRSPSASPASGRQRDGAREHGLEEALALHGGEAGDEAEDEVAHDVRQSSLSGGRRTAALELVQSGTGGRWGWRCASTSKPAAASASRAASSSAVRKTEGVTGARPGAKWTLPTLSRRAWRRRQPAPGRLDQAGHVAHQHQDAARARRPGRRSRPRPAAGSGCRAPRGDAERHGGAGQRALRPPRRRPPPPGWPAGAGSRPRAPGRAAAGCRRGRGDHRRPPRPLSGAAWVRARSRLLARVMFFCPCAVASSAAAAARRRGSWPASGAWAG